MPSLFTELRRRNVFRVGAAYAIVAWVLIEVASVLLPTFNAPEWVMQVFALFVILGFPIAILMAWAYEITPEGIKLDRNVSKGESSTKVTGRKIDFVIVGVLAIAVTAFAIERFVLVEEAPTPSVSSDDRRSIAILPLDNLSPNPENAYFADGIHGELLTKLSNIGSLKVISRTSVMEYRDSPKNMREIGQELGVATILEGDVRRAGDTVRINVQLIDAETDEHLWAEIYDRELTAENVFAIQSEMATSIAEALQATLSPQEAARINEVPTQNTRAYEFFLSARDYQWRSNRRTQLPLAIRQYQRALAEDPEFALAWAELSRAHGTLYWFGIDRTEMRRRLAFEAVESALALEPDLPEAHLAMGYYYYNGFRDYASASREFAIAEQGMPGNSELYTARSFIHRRSGRWQDSLESMSRSIDLDPRNVSSLWNQARSYQFLRDYTQAEQLLDRALEIGPDDRDAYHYRVAIPLYRDGDTTLVKAAAENPPIELGVRRNWLGWLAALYERDYEAALSYLDTLSGDLLREESNFYVLAASASGVIHQLAGQPELAEPHFQAARARLVGAVETNPEDYRFHLALGEALAGLGERDEALEMARGAMGILPTSRDAVGGSQLRLDAIIRVLVPARAYDAAIDELDAYLAAPGAWSIEGLLPDPRLDPIRDDPRFQALVEKYSR